MLERSVGAGHVRAEAAIRMSFDRLNQTEERFDPEGRCNPGLFAGGI